jgi:CRP-like cAMP-binding protein
MDRSTDRSTRNLLLRRLSAGDYALLHPHLETVEVGKGDVLIRPDEAITCVHFPETCLASIVAISPEGPRIEAGLFGYDGMSGVPIVLGADRSPNETFVQIEGRLLRLPVDALRHALDRSPVMLDLFLRFAQAMSVQLAHTVLSNGLHDITGRLARWILMCHDRIEGDELPLTHEFMSLMLGVRRPGVTTALHALEGGHLVKAMRGRVTVRNRAGLEAFAAGAYGVPEAEYERLIAPLARRGEAVACFSSQEENV